MGKIKQVIGKLSLKLTFMLYVFIFLIIATGLTSYTINLMDKQSNAIVNLCISDSNSDTVQYKAQSGIKIVSVDSGMLDRLPPKDRIAYNLCTIISSLAAPFWFCVCIFTAAVLFYRSKLKTPLKLLNIAADNITNNNLDFKVEYEKKDEMGKLCDSFEKMRTALQENNLFMWRQMEERKRLNAAFSHDLRTPLTVLKGHTDMLVKYVPEGRLTDKKIAETAKTMSEHITRLENYVNGMNHLQKLEDIEINKKPVNKEKLMKKLSETASIVCANFTLQFTDHCRIRELKLDEENVCEIYENLLSNAVQYAKSTVFVDCSFKDGFLHLTVSDDGTGFELKDIAKVTQPYYKARENVYDSHFGLGLNICKILCNKHGGDILISNRAEGGACVEAVIYAE